MTTNESTIDGNVFQSNELGLSSQSISFLDTASKWAKFLAIVGFVFIGLFVIMAFTAGALFSQLPTPVPGALFTVIFLIVAVISFFPIYYIFNFAVKTQRAIKSNDTSTLTSAFENLKSHYKFMGILTIIYLSIYVPFLLIALAGGAFAAASGM